MITASDFHDVQMNATEADRVTATVLRISSERRCATICFNIEE